MSGYREVFARKEIKYLLTQEQLDTLMPVLETMAKVDEYGKTRINNIYFDTPDHRLIRTSLEKPMYKEKLRLRTYGRTDDETNSFIEIKKKYDGIVYKRRISAPYGKAMNYLMAGLEPLDDSQIAKEIEAFKQVYINLRPAMKICYDRVAMAGTIDPDFRVTFDSNLQWSIDSLDLREEVKGNAILAPGNYMMEIKAGDAMPLELVRKMSELAIFPASFSKYGKGYMDMMERQLTRKVSDTVFDEASNVASDNTAENRKLSKRGVITYA